ncbi:hypothetical protein JHD49_08015, partial [Sulfurimonas sp. SAG-AH-194-C21]|nr:hypothetical protein [Sulfurimonas sp. SAG-AH-194-C21]
MQKTIIKFILVPSLFIILFSAIYYNQVQHEVNNLIHQRYLEATQQDKRQLNTLIQEKQENILAVSLAISKYSSVEDVLLGKGNKELKLKEFSKLLKNATSLKNLWFQILDKDGKSLYRSFSDKIGDNLCRDRVEVEDIIDYPRVISTISVGKFSITYKTLVPIYYKGEFIGVFETLAHFNSISKKIKQKGLDSILLVDKVFKKQMIHSVHKTFIEEYNLVSLNPNPHFLKYLQEVGPEKILKHTAKAYIVSKNHDVLISTYHLHDYLDNDIGYYILFKNLDDIDTSDVVQLQNNLYLLYGILLLIAYIFLYYRYKRMKDFEIDKKNKKLEEKIKMKNDVLEYVSLHDTLTSLPNRILFTKR